jgi:hypothetical protein
VLPHLKNIFLEGFHPDANTVTDLAEQKIEVIHLSAREKDT